MSHGLELDSGALYGVEGMLRESGQRMWRKRRGGDSLAVMEKAKRWRFYGGYGGSLGQKSAKAQNSITALFVPAPIERAKTYDRSNCKPGLRLGSGLIV